MDRDAAQTQAVFHHKNGLAQLGGLNGGPAPGWPRTDDHEIKALQNRPLQFSPNAYAGSVTP